jgi:hypothetical protein
MARQKPQDMTMEELLALPVSFGIRTAARALGIGESTAYVMAANGTFLCPVLRLSQQYRVTRPDLFRALGLDPAMVARPTGSAGDGPVPARGPRDGLSGEAVRALYDALMAAARVLVDRNAAP